MERIPEPELMTGTEQVLAYARADFSESHSRFIDLFRQFFPQHEIKGRVLDLGCGPADIAIRLARAFPDCRIDAVDGSREMLAQAEIALQRERLQGRIRLIRSRLQQPGWEYGNYDVVISNSLLHHLHDPAILWECIKRQGNNCLVFVMDLLRPETRQDAETLVQRYAGMEPRILQQDFLHSLCAAFRPGEIRLQLDNAGLETLQVEVVSDRHLVIYGAI